MPLPRLRGLAAPCSALHCRLIFALTARHTLRRAGSGKSNLMDAIAFVLGEKTKAMRGATLRELVHDGGKAAGAQDADADADAAGRPKKCHVTLVYADADGNETHFTRAVTAAGMSPSLPSPPCAPAVPRDHLFPPSPLGASEYRLDGVAVSYDTYDAKLRGFGILLRARNFLVYQGDVESIAGKSPKELTALFEVVSGSGALAADYAAAEAAKTAAEAATSLAFTKRKGALAQKRQKKEQKEEADKHLKLAEELVRACLCGLAMCCVRAVSAHAPDPSRVSLCRSLTHPPLRPRVAARAQSAPRPVHALQHPFGASRAATLQRQCRRTTTCVCPCLTHALPILTRTS